MRIDEFTDKDDTSAGFDLADDLHVFMRNDPMFYRKYFYPLMVKISNNKAIDKQKEFLPVIDLASKKYCKKFNIPKRPEELFTDNDKQKLIQQILKDETDNIKKGEY